MFHSENRVFKFAKFFLPSFLIMTAISGLVYAAVQQNYRMDANDPQIQFAQDAAVKLENNIQPQFVIPRERVDLTKSLAPFIIIYNEEGEVTASGAQLRGQTPTLPKGVINFVRKNGEERLTWQPDTNIRVATVVTHVNGNKGFVLAGRSLKEVEVRIDKLLFTIFLVWIATSFVLFLLSLVLASGKVKIST